MPHVSYAEPQTMRQALDSARPGRVLDLDRVPWRSRCEWVIRAGSVPLGFLDYDGAGTWLAYGVLVDVETRGCHRDSVVRNYVSRLRDELGMERRR